jgi:proliferating cell nuclear antigen
MLRAKVQAEALKSIIDTTSILVDEVKFRISNEGIYLTAVDPAHVGMIDLKLKKEAFEEFEADDTELGMDLEKIKSIMNLASPKDIVTLSYEKDDNRLTVKINNLTRKISLLDTTGMTDSKIPSLDLPAKVVVNASELARGIKASEAISDHILISADSENFELVAEGDTDIVNLKLPKDSLTSLECKEKVKSLFSLDYFSDMIKVVKSKDVQLSLGTDYPIKIEFDIAEGNGHTMYLLAPRIESE